MAGENAAKRTFQIVVAATKQMGIGKDGALPWKLPPDMAYFKALTSQTSSPGKQNAVVMGRKTWESIPSKFRPLAGRLNIVLSRSAVGDENAPPGSTPPLASLASQGVHVHNSLDSALVSLAGSEYAEAIENVFVIGGGQVYEEAFESPLCDAVHLTRVESDADCDTHFPDPLAAGRFRQWSASPPASHEGTGYSFHCFTRPGSPPPVFPTAMASRHEEYQYLDMISDIMRTGNVKGDRTGTGTISKFGTTMRFNLRESFPLLTTKRVFWRGVAEELLWFIAGSTSAKVLQEKGVHIWDGNGSREYLDSIGHTEREEGDLGPVYGFQWRHFGAEYKGMHADYSGQGVDQLADVIHKIKNNPNDRRIIMSAWNPADLKEMALPPCHMFCQFYVANGELSCQMYQRSCDLGLGVPFNIASYSLLTCMIAQVCDLKPGDFVHVLGDAHVYSNHVEPLQEQLKNEPRPFPVLKINPTKKDIDSFTFDDFEIVGYEPHKKIAMKMAV